MNNSLIIYNLNMETSSSLSIISLFKLDAARLLTQEIKHRSSILNSHQTDLSIQIIGSYLAKLVRGMYRTVIIVNESRAVYSVNKTNPARAVEKKDISCNQSITVIQPGFIVSSFSTSRSSGPYNIVPPGQLYLKEILKKKAWFCQDLQESMKF